MTTHSCATEAKTASVRVLKSGDVKSVELKLFDI